VHELTHKEQECSGNCNFTNVQCVMTRGFCSTIPNPGMIVWQALESIRFRYGTNADYLQVFIYVGVNIPQTKIFAVHDGERVTFMLADEY